MQAIIGSKRKKILFYIFIFIFLSTITFFENSVILDKKSFFHLDKIEIDGNKKVNYEVIIEKLNSLKGTNLFLLNHDDIQNILNEDKLIRKFTINKHYPNKIYIKIEEVDLVATIKKNNEKYYLTDNGHLVLLAEEFNYESLPEIYGKGAEKNFNDFLQLLKKNNFNLGIISSYRFFQINRWDLVINDEKTLKLPSKNLTNALILAKELLNNKDFDKYSIIDLRINNKIITQ